MTKIKLRDLLIPALIILIALGLIFIPRLLPPETQPGSGMKILVMVNGTEYTRQDLRPGETLEIRQENGCLNVVHMTENGFYMEHANCRNQDCVQQGEVTKDNYTKRILGNEIICLPNRVEVVLLFDEGTMAPDMPDASLHVKVGSI